MSVSELVQLYTPLAGIVALAFWVGVLSQKVKTLERDARDLKDQAAGTGSIRDRLTAIETKFDIAIEEIHSLKRGMDGVQRQLANVAGMKGGQVMELPSNN